MTRKIHQIAWRRRLALEARPQPGLEAEMAPTQESGLRESPTNPRCNDGTIWYFLLDHDDDHCWEQFPDIPQPDR
jgi:hypothetical protein